MEPGVVGDLSCDVAVIGGGLGGMSAALRLAELGSHVVLVESDVCGWGASSRNAGYLTATVGSDPRILKRFYADDRARGFYRFANNALMFTQELIANRSIECDYELSGLFAASATAAGFKRVLQTTKSGKRSTVATAEEAGVPPAFYGGIHSRIGGVINPGKFALGVRDVVRTSGVRVFEQTTAHRVLDQGDAVIIDVPRGRIRADRVILTTNAFTNRLDIAPGHLCTPVWVTAVETEPVSAERLDAAGWTSRTPIVTNHLVMQSYRTTSRDTIVFTTRKLQMPRPRVEDRVPDQSTVNDLVRGFREHFPRLGDIAPTRTWGGWIGMTPSNLAVAGRATSRVYYSMACSGHGLPQAPYLGALLADYVGREEMHDDLHAMWRETPRFAPGIVNPATLRLGWMVDRLVDRIDHLRR
jgi:glycine/D-amino acid oxidase-like deaminating enzyme